MPDAYSAFVAYPDQPAIISDAIDTAVAISENTRVRLTPWKKLRTVGLKIDDLVRENISSCDVLLADITYPNFNVYYECGFAMGIEKPVIPLVNSSIVNSTKNAERLGIFDTTGWLTYYNSDELVEKIKDWEKESWVGRTSKPKDHVQPLFILDTIAKINYRNYIFSELANSSVNYRPFDPTETPRLTPDHAITEISSSAGAILMLLQPDILDSDDNNMRAAFLAGMAHGFGIEPLIIQFDGSPAPLDYRDYITNSASRVETERHVGDYCRQVLVWNQREPDRSKRFSLNLLNKINLGASAAESESAQLADYFIQTAEYSRAVRAEGAVVVGRKGSGKTAIALRVHSEMARDMDLVVLDLRPAGHNLSDLREQLLSSVGQGLFDHTVAAFWHYVILIEMLLAVRERALKLSRNDFKLQEQIRQVERKFGLTDEFVSGDFTSRLEISIEQALGVLGERPSPDEVRERITNSMYERVIPDLRNELLKFGAFYTGFGVLLDDLDKNWPPRKLEPYDVKMLRHLIDVLKRMQRDFRRRDTSLQYLMFLRTDVYDNLVEVTPDRGKDNAIPVDWSDREELEHLLKERFLSSFDGPEGEEAWNGFNVKMDDGRHAVDHLIDASLYRPRFLIEVAERVLSFAVNRGHSLVKQDDVEQALNQMSLYLVSDFAYEMRNVAGTPDDIFYAFLGTTGLLTHEEVVQRIGTKWPEMDHNSVVDLLIWYGFLGIIADNNEPIFIFDRSYDFRRLLAERPADPKERLYAVNVAFTRGLRQAD